MATLGIKDRDVVAAVHIVQVIMGAVKRALKLIRRRPWEQCDRYEMEALWKSDRYHKHSLSLLRHHWQNVTGFNGT